MEQINGQNSTFEIFPSSPCHHIFKYPSESIKDEENQESLNALHMSSDREHNSSIHIDKSIKNQDLQQLDQPLSFNNKTNQLFNNHPACLFRTDKQWLDCQYHDLEHTSIKKPDEVENDMEDPIINDNIQILDRIQGSMIGMALGDALGAHVEFRPREYLREHPVEDLIGGGTWGLNTGQFTDDTSMALCLANSLVARRDFLPYDQLVRYKWWHLNGYMSSTGNCFDIGAATSDSLREFGRRQKEFAEKNSIPINQIDFLSDLNLLEKFDVMCSTEGVAGNGALMRLAPVPLFFYKYPIEAVEYSGISGQITHGDQKAYDACRYYGALIVAALHGETKDKLLDKNFYFQHINWFSGKPLHSDIMEIAQGSYQKKGGYDDGIRGKGYIVSALEAALWAFWADGDSFKTGVLAAINLGDDTDTTAAIYGQLAGAYYGYKNLPAQWVDQIYAKKFIETLSKWIDYEGQNWKPKNIYPTIIPLTFLTKNNPVTIETSIDKSNLNSESTTKLNDVFDIVPLQEANLIGSLNNEPSHESQSNIYHKLSYKNPTDNKSTLYSNRTEFEIDTSVKKQDKIIIPSSFSQRSTSIHRSIYKYIDQSNNLATWSVDDVCRWLQTLGENYDIYVNLFRKDHIDGFRLFRFINHYILTQYGITNQDHQQKILDGIQQLKQNHMSVVWNSRNA
ncbi:unnamed protein product [Rotaria sordida]|uniref:ADP-ribosylhydrolase ARH3 n=1 Tax=Rotaria sordida TaxID=392033 RepID=A0A814GTW5_9BILA|nr:unnamed protein product [Rotaria sordida]CAF1402732.1 unnamed protein product [Rotaria sordida]